jgi:hypothetical protein
MIATETVSVLNRLLHVLCRSLPMYLAEARPWSRPEHRAAQKALDLLVADRHDDAMRVAEAIVERGGHPDPGVFPIEFSAMNDLAMDFLLRKVLEGQHADIAAIRQCAAELAGEPPFQELAEEILGNAKGHAEILGEIAGREGD